MLLNVVWTVKNGCSHEIIIIIIIIITVCSYKWRMRLFSTPVTCRLTGTQDSVTTDVLCNIHSCVPPPPLKHWINIKLCSVKQECISLSGSTDIFEMCLLKFYVRHWSYKYEGWNFNSGNYLFTTDIK